MKGTWRVPGFIALFTALAWLACAASAAVAADKPSLTADDCVKCHAGPPADVAAAGGKHKSDVSCLDCHAGHRPASKNNIPRCSQCHEGKPHYQLKACLECHKNPHKPLTIVFAPKITEPCLSCHTEQDKQLKGVKSRHSSLGCTTCHDVHRTVPACVKCHKPHSAEMAQADCRKCHKAHQPTNVAYGADVPSKDCGACHKAALGLLAASDTKHKSLACVRCHADKHKVVPTCEKCHGQKHPAAMMKRFPKCGSCHAIAHDLNHFRDAAQAEKPKAAPAPKKRKK